MKIAHVVCIFPPYKGGIGNAAYNFSKGLTKLRHEVTVFAPLYKKFTDKDYQELSDLPKAGFRAVYLKPVFSYGNAAILLQLFWKLWKFDVVHLHYPFFGSAEVVWFLKKIRGKKMKFILHYHMNVRARGGLLGRYFSFYTKNVMPWILRSADMITCASLDYLENSDATGVYNEKPDRYFEVPFGVNSEKFKPQEKDEELMRKYNFTEEDKIILFVGGLDKAHYFKGIDVLLKAFSKIENKSIKLLIVGDGDMKEVYEKKAQRLKIKERVIFSGRVGDKDLPKYYNLSDLFVLPSTDSSEAFGLVLLEAMASGKACVASDLPGVRKVVNHKSTGMLAKPGDDFDLFEKIITILKDPFLLKSMGTSGRQRVLENYNWTKSASELESIYNKKLLGSEAFYRARRLAGFSSKKRENKVCLINSLYKPYTRGGAEKVVETIAKGFKKQNIKVFVITGDFFSFKNIFKPRVKEIDGVKVYYFYPLNIFSFININKKNFFSRLVWHFFDMFNLHSAWMVKKILKKEKPNLVITNNLKGLGYLIPQAVYNLGMKYIHILHDIQLSVPSGILIKGKEDSLQHKIFLRSWYEWCSKRLFSWPDIVISPSKWLMDFYEQKEFFKLAKKNVLPNPVLESNNQEIRRRKKDNIDFIFVGQLEEYKGILFLLNVFDRLNDKNIRLHIVGQGRALKEAKIIANGNERIKFYGYLGKEKLANVYKISDFTIVPSLCFENSPNVIYESFSFGVPVLAADIGGVSELVRERENGFIFKAGEEDDLLVKIKFIISNKEDLIEMRKKAMESISEYNIDEYIKRLMQV